MVFWCRKCHISSTSNICHNLWRTNTLEICYICSFLMHTTPDWQAICLKPQLTLRKNHLQILLVIHWYTLWTIAPHRLKGKGRSRREKSALNNSWLRCNLSLNFIQWTQTTKIMMEQVGRLFRSLRMTLWKIISFIGTFDIVLLLSFFLENEE